MYCCWGLGNLDSFLELCKMLGELVEDWLFECMFWLLELVCCWCCKWWFKRFVFLGCEVEWVVFLVVFGDVFVFKVFIKLMEVLLFILFWFCLIRLVRLVNIVGLMGLLL